MKFRLILILAISIVLAALPLMAGGDLRVQTAKAASDDVFRTAVCKVDDLSSFSTSAVTVNKVVFSEDGRTITFEHSKGKYEFVYESTINRVIGYNPATVYDQALAYKNTQTGTYMFTFPFGNDGYGDRQVTFNQDKKVSNIAPSAYKVTTSNADYNDFATNANQAKFNCPFPYGGKDFNSTIVDHGDQPPTITVGGSDPMDRPDIIYKLTHVNVKGGAAFNDNLFYFTPTVTTGRWGKYKNLAIVVDWRGTGDRGWIVDHTDDYDYKADYDGHSWVYLDADSIWDNLINKAYNKSGDGTACGPVVGPSLPDKTADWGPSPGPGAPYVQCINLNGVDIRIGTENMKDKDGKGWLWKWAVSASSVSFSAPSGTTVDYCGATTWVWKIRENLRVTLCNLGIMLHEAAGSFTGGAADFFGKVIGMGKKSY